MRNFDFLLEEKKTAGMSESLNAGSFTGTSNFEKEIRAQQLFSEINQKNQGIEL